MLVAEFGTKYALMEQLAIYLQFSQVRPDEKIKSVKALASSVAKSVVETVPQRRFELPIRSAGASQMKSEKALRGRYRVT